MKHIFFVWILFFCGHSFSQKMLSFQDEKIPKPLIIDSVVENFNKVQSGFISLSPIDKEFYYWVNYSRKNPKRFYDSIIYPILEIYPQLLSENTVSLKNDLYNTSPLILFSLNQLLTKMAYNHSLDITASNSSPSHVSTTGQTFSQRFFNLHLNRCGSENISYGQNEPIFLLSLLYIDINVSNLGHRRTLLNPALTETGIGSSFYKNGSLFLVEDFACSQK